MKWHTLNYRNLSDEGFAVYQTDAVKLLFTLRGCCMIDVFDLEICRPIGYLDFDLHRDAILAHAFGSPLIGLPFTSQLRRKFGKLIFPFNDLRSGHDVGFFVKKPYRNKGEKGVWNLDEILMAIALETAREHGLVVFTIKPTGDRARYYRRKFGAETWPTTATDLILSIKLDTIRKNFKHIEIVETAGKTLFFKVQGAQTVTGA
ncbi:MAG: hypothetical protein ABIK98_10890 [Pseudomonadota bacterium]|uniref:Uncharacterized protein n=1 Tax=Candidatus Desulfatibia profunda TaxID=2841695 RepID=A0A8J6TK95_9BACT|nr:hypothetical protein [Candidatus Desulfatibia profunda]MBL7179097.1 hypothetical protein [Desulfobacterales bacterium]MBU0699083.1 hypothetical protein [Pseudomonadota bacterium]